MSLADGNEPLTRVCCGPRCGQEPGHRAIYAAVEIAVRPAAVRPVLCQGLCGAGITVILPDGERRKLRDIKEARQLLSLDKQK